MECPIIHKSYIQKLVSQGYKVAIVEQVEDPKEVKGLVRREVVEIITPGTFIENEEVETNEIGALHSDLVYATLVLCNITSGSLRAVQVLNESLEIIKALQQYQVKEIVVGTDFDQKIIRDIKDKTAIFVSYQDQDDTQIKHEDHAIEKALQKMIGYLNYTQKRNLDHLGEVVVLSKLSYLKMDYASIANLELIQHGTNKDLSLFSFLNKTQTHIGARTLKDALLQPLIDTNDIKFRQDVIEFFLSQGQLADQLRGLLKESYDIHRVIAKVATQKNNSQDFIRLKNTLNIFTEIQSLAKDNELLSFVCQQNDLREVYLALESAVHDDAPVQLKDGRTFKSGLNAELDELLSITKDGRKWLLNYEAEQREKTGIKNLKVGYTRAFGYYIEITKGQVDNVKEDHGFIRRQTLTNAERYISEELQEYETKVLAAGDRILAIEQELFKKYTEYVLNYAHEIQKIGEVMGELDMLLALTEISSLPGYVKPTFNNSNIIDIQEGRHPVLEQELSSHQYIASDVNFDEEHQLQILTGPNMGGKSTYMRMVALIIIMGQMGAYVPADSATLSIVDQIFTRMGASDDILMGQSTFMIEMLEAQSALSKATKNSLILFDEIGRGTSTYDGMALAQAILEYIVHSVGCNTIFSTHYHELTSLESMYPGIKNIHVEVHEEDDKVTFLYRILEGRADKSYGINVARLAHLPQTVIERAKQNLEALEAQKESLDLNKEVVIVKSEPQDYTSAKNLINKIDINHVTPMEALTLLSELKNILGDNNE